MYVVTIFYVRRLIQHNTHWDIVYYVWYVVILMLNSLLLLHIYFFLLAISNNVGHIKVNASFYVVFLCVISYYVCSFLYLLTFFYGRRNEIYKSICSKVPTDIKHDWIKDTFVFPLSVKHKIGSIPDVSKKLEFSEFMM